MATAANEATSLAEVIPTILRDVVAAHRLAAGGGVVGDRPTATRCRCPARPATSLPSGPRRGHPPRPRSGRLARPHARSPPRAPAWSRRRSWPRSAPPASSSWTPAPTRRPTDTDGLTVAPGHRDLRPGRRARAGRGATRAGAGQGDERVDGQVRVPRDDEPRDPHPPQRRDRAVRAAGAHRADRPPAPARRRHRRRRPQPCSPWSTTSSTCPRSRPGGSSSRPSTSTRGPSSSRAPR